MTTVSCPGCGYRASPNPALPDPPGSASRECWWRYGELSAYDIQRARTDFLHQEAVDAYAAQHPGDDTKPITLWFALVGLHLAVDRGWTGRAVQRAHMKLARDALRWEPIRPPADLAGMSAADVLTFPAGEERDGAILDWARFVWSRWEPVHDRIADLCTAHGLA